MTAYPSYHRSRNRAHNWTGRHSVAGLTQPFTHILYYQIVLKAMRVGVSLLVPCLNPELNLKYLLSPTRPEWSCPILSQRPPSTMFTVGPQAYLWFLELERRTPSLLDELAGLFSFLLTMCLQHMSMFIL